MATTSKITPSPALPPTLRTAAALLAVEALGILVIGGWLLVGTLTEGGDGLAIGLSSALFMIVAGVGVGLLSIGVLRARAWSRGPVTLVQFLQLPIGWQFLAEPTTPAGMTAVAMAIVVLVLMFLPSSTRAFESSRSSDAADSPEGEGKLF